MGAAGTAPRAKAVVTFAATVAVYLLCGSVFVVLGYVFGMVAGIEEQRRRIAESDSYRKQV